MQLQRRDKEDWVSQYHTSVYGAFHPYALRFFEGDCIRWETSAYLSNSFIVTSERVPVGAVLKNLRGADINEFKVYTLQGLRGYFWKEKGWRFHYEQYLSLNPAELVGLIESCTLEELFTLAELSR